MKKAEPTSELRITTQYRARRGMIYELECRGATLDIHVLRRDGSDGAGEWCVEAHDGHSRDAVVISCFAATRREALRGVGQAWAERGPSSLAAFDWDAVARTLTTVRAL
jgi:hypothetical protein